MSRYQILMVVCIVLCFWRYINLFFIVNDIIPDSRMGDLSSDSGDTDTKKPKRKITMRLALFTFCGLLLLVPLIYGAHLLILQNQQQ